jgi:hypothetical protein
MRHKNKRKCGTRTRTSAVQFLTKFLRNQWLEGRWEGHTEFFCFINLILPPLRSSLSLECKVVCTDGAASCRNIAYTEPDTNFDK